MWKKSGVVLRDIHFVYSVYFVSFVMFFCSEDGSSNDRTVEVLEA